MQGNRTDFSIYILLCTYVIPCFEVVTTHKNMELKTKFKEHASESAMILVKIETTRPLSRAVAQTRETL